MNCTRSWAIRRWAESPCLSSATSPTFPRDCLDELIDELDLKSIQGREVCCYGISAKEETNLDAVVQFLVKWAGR